MKNLLNQWVTEEENRKIVWQTIEKKRRWKIFWLSESFSRKTDAFKGSLKMEKPYWLAILQMWE